MAQSSASIYTSFINNQLVGPFVDFDTDTIKVMLVTSGYTYSASHDFIDDVSASETSGDNYVAGGQTLANVTTNTSNNTTSVFSDDSVWAVAAGSPFTFRAAVVYKDTGTPATSPVISYHDFGEDLDNDGNIVTIAWSTGAIVSYVGVTIQTGTDFPILAPDGSAAAPSYSFASDPDTGMYWTAGSGVGFEEVVLSADGSPACAFRTSGIRNYATNGRVYGNIDATGTGNDWVHISQIPSNLTEVTYWSFPDNNNAFFGNTNNRIVKIGDGSGGAAHSTWGMVNDEDIDAEGAASGQVLISNGGTGTGSVGWGAIPLDIVLDTTPQLGGELDTNGFAISSSIGDLFLSSTSSGVQIDGNGGSVRLGYDASSGGGTGGISFVDVSGTKSGFQHVFDMSQVITSSDYGKALVLSSSNNKIRFETIELISDTTPQLGGNLDVQANSITTSTSNGDITLSPNGTGVVDIDTTLYLSGAGVLDLGISNITTSTTNGNISLTPNGTGVVDITGGVLDIGTGDITTSTSNTDITLTPNGVGASVNIGGTSGWIQRDTTDLTIRAPDANILLNPADITGTVVFNGTLDVKSYAITTSSTNGDITLTPDGIGAVVAGGPVELPSYTVATTPAGSSVGQIAYFTDGDAGSACLGVYDGTNWKVVALGATISAT